MQCNTEVKYLLTVYNAQKHCFEMFLYLYNKSHDLIYDIDIFVHRQMVILYHFLKSRGEKERVHRFQCHTSGFT